MSSGYPPRCIRRVTVARALFEIAEDIWTHWPNVRYSAKPYLEAMEDLVDITDDYGQDSAEEMVLYFLSNAVYWRGEHARRIKAELNSMIEELHK
jgi:hypothetical protein